MMIEKVVDSMIEEVVLVGIGWHMPPSGPENPALHVQSVEASLAAGASEFAGHAEHVDADLAPFTAEKVPGPQSLHPALPASALYFPATQLAHGPPFGPCAMAKTTSVYHSKHTHTHIQTHEKT